MEKFNDLLGGLANSAATVLGAINGVPGRNTQISTASQEQAIRLEAQQRSSATFQKVLIFAAIGLAAVLAIVMFRRK